MTGRRFQVWIAFVLTALVHAAPPASGEEPAKEYLGKATLGVYSVPGSVAVDVNLRYKLAPFTVWAGGYFDEHESVNVGRVGAEYDFQTDTILAIPSLVVATNGFVGGAFYSEIGKDFFGIAGYSQTNLKPTYSLTYDPNESVQIGAGWKLPSGARLMAFTIFDVRLGTGQQDTHLVWRTPLPRGRRLTVDLMYKSGHTEEEEYVRGFAIGVTYDWPSVFVKAAFDEYVNFTTDDQVRVGGGFRF